MKHYRYFLKKIFINFINFILFFEIFRRIFSRIHSLQMQNEKTIKVDNKILKFINFNSLTNFRINTFFIKEPDTLKWINTFNENDIFWDIGANIGLYSIYAAKIKNTRTFAFEPSVFNLELLARNIFLNNLSDKITIIPNPLNDSNKISKFQLSSIEYSSALSVFDKNHNQFGNEFKMNFEYYFNSFTIDAMIKSYDLKTPSHIKIDVDGLEHLVLAGGILTLPYLKSILIETNDFFIEQSEEIIKILKKNKFRLQTKSQISNENGVKMYNQIWINSEI